MKTETLRIPLLSVVIPCYNEEAVINETIKRLQAFCLGLENLNVELIFVDDGSQDATRQLIKNQADKDSRIKLIAFARNFGHQIAVTAGIDSNGVKAMMLFMALGFRAQVNPFLRK